MEKKFNLGFIKNGSSVVEVDMDKSDNGHIAVIGKSGSGKSSAISYIAKQCASQGNLVVEFDIFSTVDANKLPNGLRGEFLELTHNIDVHKNGFKCNLFDPIMNAYGEEETVEDMCDAIEDIFLARDLLGYKQRGAFRRAVECIYDNKDYKKGIDVVNKDGTIDKVDGIIALTKSLDEDDSVEATQVKNRYISFLEHNIFRSGELDLVPGKINIIRLSAFSDSIQVQIAEMILRYLWRLAENNYFKGKGIMIVVDEVQNYTSNKNSIVSKMLAMGRKFNISMVTATQKLDLSSKNTIQQNVLQSSLRLYFEPDPSQAKKVAQCIDPKDENKWTLPLKRLEKGNFIACGDSITVKNKACNQPLNVGLILV